MDKMDGGLGFKGYTFQTETLTEIAATRGYLSDTRIILICLRNFLLANGHMLETVWYILACATAAEYLRPCIIHHTRRT